MGKRTLLALLVCLFGAACRAMPDSLLMRSISGVDGLMRAGMYDSVAVRVNELLPFAKENGNVLAEAMLHGMAGMCLAQVDDREEAMKAFMRSTAIAERNNILLKAIADKTGTLITLFSTIYGVMSFFSKEQGNTVESLHYARNALRWLSYSNDGRLRASVMLYVMPALAVNKEWLPAYDFLKQSFADALAHRLYDFALDLARYLLLCEDEAFGRGPEAYDWMEKADSVLPLAQTEEAKKIYMESRDIILAKYSTGDAAGPLPQQSLPVSEISSDGMHTALPESSGQYSSASATKGTYGDADTTQGDADPASSSAPSMLRTVLLSVILFFPLLAILALTQWRRLLTYKKNERMLTEKYMEGQEDERNRLARELHDGVSNQLLALEMKFSTDGLTHQTMQLLNESREQVRRVSHELIQPEFTHSSLDKVIASYAAEMCGVRHCEVSCMVTPPDSDWSAVPETTALSIYRIVQEVVSNVLKHAAASVISIGLHRDEAQNIMIIISDNGEAWQRAGVGNTTEGIGLTTIRQRAEVIGGTPEFYRHQYGNVFKLVVRVS